MEPQRETSVPRPRMARLFALFRAFGKGNLNGVQPEPHDHSRSPYPDGHSNAIPTRSLPSAWLALLRTLRGPPPNPTNTDHKVVNQLPIDIVVIIVGILFDDPHYDVAMLQSCALVSQNWRLGARPYVFRRITLRDQEAFHTFQDLLLNEPGVKGYVQELTFGEKRFRKFSPPPRSTWVHRALPILSPLLPMVHTIQFSQQFRGQEEVPTDDFFAGLAGFTSVTRLVLQRCGCREDFPLRCAFILPKLRDIDVRSPELYAGHPHHVFPDSPTFRTESAYSMALDSLRLSSLRLSDAAQWELTLLRWLLTSPSRTHLRVLRVEVNPGLEIVGRAIVELGPHLEELELDLHCFLQRMRTYNDPPTSGDLLRTCTALRRLTLNFIDAYTLQCAVKLLEQVPATHLECLTLRLRQRRGDYRIPNLIFLNTVLAGQRFLHVRNMEFGYVGPMAKEEVWKWVEDVMPVAVTDRLAYTHQIRDVCYECELEGITDGHCGHPDPHARLQAAARSNRDWQ